MKYKPIHIGWNYWNTDQAINFFSYEYGNVLFIARQGWGKCLTKDNYLRTGEGEIKSISDIKKGEFVPSFNVSNGEIEYKEVLGTTSRKYEGKVLNIKIRGGNSIKVTPNHKMFSLDIEGNIIEKNAADFIEGDFLLIPKTISSMNISNKVLSQEHARLTGYLLGDGYIDDRRLIFSTPDSFLAKDFMFCLGKVFGQDYSDECFIRKRKNCYHVDFGIKSKVQNVLSKLGLKKSVANTKEIPVELMSSTIEIKKHLLMALFGCDAGLVNKFRAIEYCTASKKMMRQVEYLLLEFGIPFTQFPKTVKEVTYFRLKIGGYINMGLWMDKVGFKLDSMNKLYNEQPKIKSGNAIYNVFPGQLLPLKRLMEKIKWNTKDWTKNELIWKYRPNKSKIQIDVFLSFLALCKQKFPEIVNDPDYKKVKFLLDSGVYFNSISKITVEEIIEEVYDLQVQDNHNYFVGIDYPMLVHNSTVAKQIILELSHQDNRQIIVFDKGGEWRHNLTRPNWDAETPLAINKYHEITNFSIKLSDIKGNDWYYLDSSLSPEVLAWISRLAIIGEPIHQDDPEEFYKIVTELPTNRGDVPGWNDKYGDHINLKEPIHIEIKKSMVSKVMKLKDRFLDSKVCLMKGTQYIENWTEEIKKAPVIFIDMQVQGYKPDAFVGYMVGHILEKIEKDLIDMRPIIVVEEADALVGHYNTQPIYKSTDMLLTYVTKYRKRSVCLFFISQTFSQLHPDLTKTPTAEIVGQIDTVDRRDKTELWTKIEKGSNLLQGRRAFYYLDHIRCIKIPFYPKIPSYNPETQGVKFK